MNFDLFNCIEVIFLYNPVPEYSPYVDEILAVYDKIINGDLIKIN